MSKQTVETIEADTSTWLTLDMDIGVDDELQTSRHAERFERAMADAAPETPAASSAE